MDKHISLDAPKYNKDPYDEFAKRHDVSREVWVKMYHTGYMWRQYTLSELVEYYKILTQSKPISSKTITRWIQKTEQYNKVQKAKEKGARLVTNEFFQ